MLEDVLRFSIRRRWLILVGTLALGAFGLYAYSRLDIDAVPDITNVQVQINTEASGYSPLEAEQRVTYLVETAMAGLPRLEETRSISRYGLSQVTVVFEDGTDIYFARQLIAERIGTRVVGLGHPEVDHHMPIAGITHAAAAAREAAALRHRDVHVCLGQGGRQAHEAVSGRHAGGARRIPRRRRRLPTRPGVRPAGEAPRGPRPR